MSSAAPSTVAYQKAGWLVWLTLAVAITVAVIGSIAAGRERSVTPAYRSAVYHWFAGEPLYNMHGSGFLYLPQAALTFAPWAVLPHPVCEIVWRWSIIGLLALSVAQLNRLLKGDGRWFFTMSISAAVLAWGCAQNGQSTLLITAMMIMSVVDLTEARWWRAAGLLSLAFAFKPLVIVLILLAAVVYPQMSWRLAIGMAVVAIAPFATQHPEYVLSQYQACLQNLQITFDVGDKVNWAQLFGMLQVAGIDIPSPARTGLRAVAALATLAICWKAARTLTPDRFAYYLFSLSACYLMLFNSRTEGNTYAMVGPVYGALLAEAAFRLKNQAASNWLIAAIVLSVLNYELAILVSSRANAIWVSPLVCVGVSGYLLARLVHEMRDAHAAKIGQTGVDQIIPTNPQIAKAA